MRLLPLLAVALIWPCMPHAGAAECCDHGDCPPGSCSADGACPGAGCATCPACRPKWEDKKTKKPRYSQKCAAECVRGFDAWCDGSCHPDGCCAEKTSPCGAIFTRKKLFKKDDDKVERVLKYELVQVPVAPCPAEPSPPRCPAWYDLRGWLSRCLGR